MARRRAAGREGSREKASVVFLCGWQETFKLVWLLLKPATTALGLHTSLFLLPDAFLFVAKGATHYFDQRRSVDTGDYKMYESFRSRSQPWLPVKAVT